MGLSYVNMPVGGAHGWGVCGSYLARHLAAMQPTFLLTDPFDLSTIGDELELFALQQLLPSPERMRQIDLSKPFVLDGPLFKSIEGRLHPSSPNLRGTRTIGYTFFERTRLEPAEVEQARQHFDHIVAGSSWCERILRDAGLENVSTVIQGVDDSVFHPSKQSREFLRDKFVVFSGGKFEFRKGQDLVIRAFKVLQDRHTDVMLVYAWHNRFEKSYSTMRSSTHIRFDGSPIEKVLADNGIDLARTIAIAPRMHRLMAPVYWNTDVGLFPNRAEGGTNLVLMEYMACGKPVLATNATGHADVVNPDNAYLIGTKKRFQVRQSGELIIDWPEPDVEQTIELLEWAYQNREQLKTTQSQTLTWRGAAEQFLKLMTA